MVLDSGNVVGIGTHDYLLQNCDVYREIHESQNKKGGLK
ncbi:MAG: ABC transporter ATP-binding protein [Clostridia bacterium]|nr:ABC transporter ATP-binding protein [Clostridia bacterium]